MSIYCLSLIGDLGEPVNEMSEKERLYDYQIIDTLKHEFPVNPVQ